jgi:hypothetical protein
MANQALHHHQLRIEHVHRVDGSPWWNRDTFTPSPSRLHMCYYVRNRTT